VNRSKPTDRRVSMDDVESLAHTLWECKYHVAWTGIPHSVIGGGVRIALGAKF